MTPLDLYRQALNQPTFIHDPAQARIIERLDHLHQELGAAQIPSVPLLQRLLGRPPMLEPVRGLYLWGGVGRGKTYLMDTFYDALAGPQKLRLHFHRFMQRVHEELRSLKNQANPLTEVARHFAEQARVLCLDEMQVNDIADAMIMGGLLRNLFGLGVTLVTTANVAPDHLYRNGLQRDRFLPAIDLIQRHTEVTELDGSTDYRLRHLRQAEVYRWPLDAGARACLERHYREAVAVDHPKPKHILINQREIPVVRWTDGVVWFDFDVICNIPRSQLDHVEVARYFHTVVLENVRRMDDGKSDMVHRLITLVDAFYDRSVKLLISAEVPPEQLYGGHTLAFEFQRTLSRLKEIQSEEYLARPHLA
jgi:cell division protein ZapE